MDNAKRGERLLFIGGCPRSGTTLVQNILDSHPDIFGGPEFDRIPAIIDLRNALHASIDAGRIDLFCDKDKADAAIAGLIEELLLPIADRNSCRYLSEKSPFNALAFKDLLQILPAARFIHVVRDPRAIVASMMQVANRIRKKGNPIPSFLTSPQNAIECIKKCAGAGFQAVRFEPTRVVNVIYERLVSNPERETKSLCDFLGVPWTESILHPGSHTHAGEKTLDEVWYNWSDYYRDPETKEIEKWKTILSPALQKGVAMAFRDNQDFLNLGYDLSESG